MAGAGTVSILIADPVASDGELEFPTVPEALSRAHQLQRANDGGARIGIAVGEQGEEADPRVVASALCARAEPGQVLASQAARSLALDAGGHDLREVGTLEVEGVGAPVRTWELLWREPQPRTRVRLCGRLELEMDGRDSGRTLPAGQGRTLLCYLLANRDRAAHRDELIAVLWPERPPRDAPAALRPVLSRLRRVLGPATLEGRERLRLTLPEPVWLDVEEAVRAVKAARTAATSGEWTIAGEEAEAALELLRPSFLPDQHGDWLDARRRELEELQLEALEWLARSGLGQGGSGLGAAERASRELIARSPFRETGYRFLMEALGRAGNVAEALRVYDELRVLLREELGTAPAAEVQELHGRLLAGEASAPPDQAASTRGAPPRVPLPTLLSPSERTAFVGRQPELDVLRAAWQEARSGSRRLVLVAGEPGIGKTRLVGEFARAAHDEGTVLYAGCHEEALVSYQPFVEALRHYARNIELDKDRLALGPGAGELARLIPELAAAAAGEAAVAPSDLETRRYLMFEAVSTLLAEASARTPLVLVLEDLHWADKPTLELMRHVVRAPDAAALLVVATYREAEIDTEHPLWALLADLRRDRLFERVSLDGLDEGGVGALIASHAGHEASSGLVGTVHEHTEGNPFFVEEVMRHLIETGVLFERGGRWTSALTPDEIGVPEGVNEVLGRRLARLSDGCRSALAQAAVLGREFGFDVLCAMTQCEEDTLIAALEEALGAQLVVEGDAPAGPTYGFTHALVRETLYGGLSRPRRQRLHARAAAAIEDVEGDGDAQVAALAVHHRLAGSAGDTGKAIDYSLRAGGRAAELSAWESAAEHWDGALAFMARARGRQPDRAAARRTRRPDGGHRRPGPPDLLPRGGVGPLRGALRPRACRAGALPARHGPLPHRFDLRRASRHPPGVPPLRRGPERARARTAAQVKRPSRGRCVDRADVRAPHGAGPRGGAARHGDRRANRRRFALGRCCAGVRLARDRVGPATRRPDD
jgi:pentatricopeptide repeat protein